MDKKIALIGCGKAGLSLSLALKGAGWEVVGCASRTSAAARAGADWLACPLLTSFGEIPAEATLILGVPEGALPEVESSVARQDPSLKGRVILHLSGAFPARVLESCRLRGASVGSIHPIMALPDPLTGAKRLKDATFAIEGRPAALEVMRAIALALSGRYFILSPRGKTLYHAAAVVASNHLVALLADSQELLGRAGADASVAWPAFQALVEGTVKNFYAGGPVSALTGPVERGDLETVKKHLQALKRWPEARERYRSMALGVLGLARLRHPERRDAHDALEKLITGWHSS